MSLDDVLMTGGDKVRHGVVQKPENTSMRIPRILALVWLVAVSPFSATRLPVSAAQASTACDKAVLPAPIDTLLRAKFPQWRPKRISDMDADNQQFWLEGRNGETCPGIAIGHFESASTLSYAFLLVPQSNPSGGYKVVVFSKDTGKDVYSSTLLDHAEGQTYSGIVIFRAEPGKYKDLTGKKSIQIRTDVLYLEWIEKGAQLYYWSEGRYRKIVVSD